MLRLTREIFCAYDKNSDSFEISYNMEYIFLDKKTRKIYSILYAISNALTITYF